MSTYLETRLDSVEFLPDIKYGLPLAVCDRSLAYHLGIHNRTLWWAVLNQKKLYRVFKLPKRGKSPDKRSIHDPQLGLKNIQKSILGKFLYKIPLGKHVGAYIPNKACAKTAVQHVKSKFILSMDIKNFFGSVKRSMIRRYFISLGYNYRVSSLLSTLLCYKNFVPQGAPSSGAIANLVADYLFDHRLIAYLKNLGPGWRYTRYSDDIDISHQEQQTPKLIHEIRCDVARILKSVGFRINNRKSKVEHFWERQKVLGAVVNEKVNIPREEYLRTRAIIHNCLQHGFVSQIAQAGKSNALELVFYLRGKLAFYKQISPRKANALKAQLEIALQTHSKELLNAGVINNDTH